jgi:hypothetical protein
MKNKFPALPEKLEVKNGNVYQAIRDADMLKADYSYHPKKPFILKGANSVTVQKYAEDLAAYEAEKEVYDKAAREAQDHNRKVYALIENLIREESGLNFIPEQYRDRVYAHAWQTGHSSGYSEVYNHLCELVDIFGVR